MTRPSRPRSPHLSPAAVALALLAAGGPLWWTAGCGRGEPKPVPVQGRITLGGGAWPKPGTVKFSPIQPEEGFPALPGVADFDVDGKFEVQTFRPADGLMPGRYRVGVVCWEQPPTYENSVGKNSYVPDAYRDAEASPLEVAVPPRAGPQQLTLDVPKP